MDVLIFQHVAGEHAAAFSEHIADAGDRAHVVHLYEDAPIPPLAGFDAMIVLGGSMDIWDTDAHPWLIREKAAIREWVGGLDRPYLGICLGLQLLVDALGGTCARLPRPSIAVAEIEQTGLPDPIFSGLPQRFPALSWHGVGATELPEDCVTLARNPACAHQVIRRGAHAWGVQFHPEVTDDVVVGWLDDAPNMAAATRALGSEEAAAHFARSCRSHGPDARVLSRALYAGLRDAVTRAD
jgi:GMP synthase-like glutamine amidotransferase